jgi:hypothetical protein
MLVVKVPMRVFNIYFTGIIEINMNYIRESPVNFQKYNLNLKTFADTSKK